MRACAGRTGLRPPNTSGRQRVTPADAPSRQGPRRGTRRLTLTTGARTGACRPSQPRRLRKGRRRAPPEPGERRFPRVSSPAARVPEPTWADQKPFLQVVLLCFSESLSRRRRGRGRQNSLGLQYQSVSHSTGEEPQPLARLPLTAHWLLTPPPNPSHWLLGTAPFAYWTEDDAAQSPRRACVLLIGLNVNQFPPTPSEVPASDWHKHLSFRSLRSFSQGGAPPFGRHRL